MHLVVIVLFFKFVFHYIVPYQYIQINNKMYHGVGDGLSNRLLPKRPASATLAIVTAYRYTGQSKQ